MNQRAEKTLTALHGDLGLALTLHWIGDRYAQRISLLQRGESRTLAVSCESDVESGGEKGADAPVFQELSIESIGGGEAACLVGMSGRDYWSAAVEILAAKRALRFDLCRKGEAAQGLTCCYRIAEGEVELLGRDRAAIRVDDALRCVIEIEPIAGMATELCARAGQLEIESRLAGGAAPLRCKFLWRLETREDRNSL